jgi:hypothetical protein
VKRVKPEDRRQKTEIQIDCRGLQPAKEHGGKSKPFNKADVNKDGVVDSQDFAEFAENWLQSSLVEE